jgi:hypothetical protein
MVRLLLQPLQNVFIPTTKGRACAARPPVTVTVFPVGLQLAVTLVL